MRWWSYLLLGGLLVALGTLGWWIFSPTFIDERVDESLVSVTMDEEMPEAALRVIRYGEFEDVDTQHRGSGRATVYSGDGGRLLRLEDFEVTNGPDLHVLLVENVDGVNREEMGAYVDLGKLKGNIGSQNYEIGEDVDLDRYEGVWIYCEPFHVVFSTAALSDESSGGSCGNGICEDVACLAVDCPEPETAQNCPVDCGV